jgi:hypothetical protein
VRNLSKQLRALLATASGTRAAAALLVSAAADPGRQSVAAKSGPRPTVVPVAVPHTWR